MLNLISTSSINFKTIPYNLIYATQLIAVISLINLHFILTFLLLPYGSMYIKVTLSFDDHSSINSLQ